MPDFEPIAAAATARAGGAEALTARLPLVRSGDELRGVPDDHYLSLMSQRIFRAGLKHSLVDAKWPAFEEVFFGFEPQRVAAMTDEVLESLMSDARLIRHWGKIKSVRANAEAMLRTATDHGGFGAWLADWPGSRIVELWEALAKQYTQLGGNSGAYFLRMAGKDTFVLTDAVLKALAHWDLFDGTAKSKRDRLRVQGVFNDLAGATGRPLSHLSMILAVSVD